MNRVMLLTRPVKQWAVGCKIAFVLPTRRQFLSLPQVLGFSQTHTLLSIPVSPRGLKLNQVSRFGAKMLVNLPTYFLFILKYNDNFTLRLGEERFLDILKSKNTLSQLQKYLVHLHIKTEILWLIKCPRFICFIQANTVSKVLFA